MATEKTNYKYLKDRLDILSASFSDHYSTSAKMFADLDKNISLTRQEIKYLGESLTKISKSIEEFKGEVVLKVEFKPVQAIVIGMVSIILIAVLTAVVNVVLAR